MTDTDTAPPKSNRISGKLALAYAETYGVRVYKSADPTEAAREFLYPFEGDDDTPDNAKWLDDVLASDPGLIWCWGPNFVPFYEHAEAPVVVEDGDYIVAVAEGRRDWGRVSVEDGNALITWEISGLDEPVTDFSVYNAGSVYISRLGAVLGYNRQIALVGSGEVL